MGSFPPYATTVGTNPDNLTYFIGSIFFTTASFLPYDEVASTPTSLADPRRRGPRSLLAVQHHRIDWWAAVIQLAGTLWFNRTTLSALLVGLGGSAAHHPVWRRHEDQRRDREPVADQGRRETAERLPHHDRVPARSHRVAPPLTDDEGAEAAAAHPRPAGGRIHVPLSHGESPEGESSHGESLHGESPREAVTGDHAAFVARTP